MKAKLMIAALAALFFVTLQFHSAAQTGTRSKPDAVQQDKRQIREIERQWAETAVTGDGSVLEKILADDFLGTDPQGKLYSKAEAIKGATGPAAFESNRLNEIKIRFFGNVAVVQGSETFKRKDGKTGRFVWTDVMVKRTGRWQVVAAEDLIAPE